jgi:enoyl-CoA hydratase
VVLTGVGDRAFVAGADINELRALAGRGTAGAMYGSRLQAVTVRWERLPKPVVAAINGYALGGGCELAMSADVRIAAENARFGQPEINLGIIPGAGGTQRLPRLVGKGYAKLMVLSGEPIDAQEALRIGLVQRVVPVERLMEEARSLAAKLAGKAPVALRLAKQAVNDGLEADLDRGLALEARSFGLALGTADAAEGTAAFLEKRAAQFKGE